MPVPRARSPCPFPRTGYRPVVAKKRQRLSGQQRAEADARRIARQRDRRRRLIAAVAVFLVIAFMATTVGALIVAGSG